MSWAEIKKAVNSNIDVPLNNLFGLQVFRKFATGGTYTITGVNGILIATPRNTSGDIQLITTIDNKQAYLISDNSYYGSTPQWQIIDKNTTYTLKLSSDTSSIHQDVVVIYAFGGGI